MLTRENPTRNDLIGGIVEMLPVLSDDDLIPIYAVINAKYMQRRVVNAANEDELLNDAMFCALVSQTALAREWDTPAEDAAWVDL